jgi:hypothetical protein
LQDKDEKIAPIWELAPILMRHLATVIFLTILYSCNTVTDKRQETISQLDTLKTTIKRENVWITTRIYPKAQIDLEAKVKGGWNDSSVVFEYKYFYHQPRTYDDQYWEHLYIYIPDTSKVRTRTVYTFPNQYMNIKVIRGGAWTDISEYYNLNGQIRFETFNFDSTLVSINLNGTIYNQRKGLWNGKVISEQINFLKNGRPDWEYNYESEQNVTNSIK